MSLRRRLRIARRVPVECNNARDSPPWRAGSHQKAPPPKSLPRHPNLFLPVLASPYGRLLAKSEPIHLSSAPVRPSARPVKGECTCFSDVTAPRRARSLECADRGDKTLAAFCRAQSRARVVDITLRRRSRFLHRRTPATNCANHGAGRGGPIACENPCSDESVSFPQLSTARLSTAQHSTASAPVLLHPLCFALSQPNAGVDV